jgi:membrane protein DedA with SNARE-associated domain/rhodanese-related sulfurtransferase
MQHILPILQQHVLIVTFLNLLLTQSGLPLPVIPTLLAAAALTGHNTNLLVKLVVVAVAGAVTGDCFLYFVGRHYGRHILARLCRLSFSPDFCVYRTEIVFAKVGVWGLLFAKFIPGVSAVAVTMAGITKVNLLRFFLFDGLGKLLYVGLLLAIGRLFQAGIVQIMSTIVEFGQAGGVSLVIAVALYVAAKWLRRQLFIRQLRMDRITVEELSRLINDEQDIVLLDVRPKEVRDVGGVIPNAMAAHPADPEFELPDGPLDQEIIVYCDCPNEASAAIAAKHLQKAGYKKIRPLLGGFDAWVEAGHPLQHERTKADELHPHPTSGVY